MLKEQDKQTLLEIGSGPGRESRFFQDNGFKVSCTDASPEMVRRCRAKGLSAFVLDFYDLSKIKDRFDAVWALNCLLHVPKSDFPSVLEGISSVLRPSGLLYMGVYGGTDSEGVWEDDYYTPKRFFSFYHDDQIRRIVEKIFDIVYFNRIPLKDVETHFRSFVVRKGS